MKSSGSKKLSGAANRKKNAEKENDIKKQAFSLQTFLVHVEVAGSSHSTVHQEHSEKNLW